MTGRDSVGWPNTTTRSIRRAEVAVEQQPVAADRRSRRCASRWSARRAAASRPARRASRAGGPGVVAGDDHRARAERERARRSRGRTTCGPRSTRCDGPGCHRSVGDERLVELHVEVQRTRRVRRQRRRTRPGRRRRRSRTSGPKIPTWSVVWLAPVPRSRAGRSAVTTTSGRRRRAPPRARPGAGWRRRCRTCTSPPRARRPWSARARGSRRCARRSRVCSRSSPASAASYAANASGALREPGREHDLGDPGLDQRARRRARASSVDGFVTSRDPAARPAPRPAGPPSAPTRSGAAASRSSAAGVDRDRHRTGRRRRPAAAARRRRRR